MRKEEEYIPPPLRSLKEALIMLIMQATRQSPTTSNLDYQGESSGEEVMEGRERLRRESSEGKDTRTRPREKGHKDQTVLRDVTMPRVYRTQGERPGVTYKPRGTFINKNWTTYPRSKYMGTGYYVPRTHFNTRFHGPRRDDRTGRTSPVYEEIQARDRSPEVVRYKYRERSPEHLYETMRPGRPKISLPKEEDVDRETTDKARKDERKRTRCVTSAPVTAERENQRRKCLEKTTPIRPGETEGARRLRASRDKSNRDTRRRWEVENLLKLDCGSYIPEEEDEDGIMEDDRILAKAVVIKGERWMRKDLREQKQHTTEQPSRMVENGPIKHVIDDKGVQRYELKNKTESPILPNKQLREVGLTLEKHAWNHQRQLQVNTDLAYSTLAVLVGMSVMILIFGISQASAHQTSALDLTRSSTLSLHKLSNVLRFPTEDEVKSTAKVLLKIGGVITCGTLRATKTNNLIRIQTQIQEEQRVTAVNALHAIPELRREKHQIENLESLIPSLTKYKEEGYEELTENLQVKHLGLRGPRECMQMVRQGKGNLPVTYKQVTEILEAYAEEVEGNQELFIGNEVMRDEDGIPCSYVAKVNTLRTHFISRDLYDGCIKDHSYEAIPPERWTTAGVPSVYHCAALGIEKSAFWTYQPYILDHIKNKWRTKVDEDTLIEGECRFIENFNHEAPRKVRPLKGNQLAGTDKCFCEIPTTKILGSINVHRDATTCELRFLNLFMGDRSARTRDLDIISRVTLTKKEHDNGTRWSKKEMEQDQKSLVDTCTVLVSATDLQVSRQEEESNKAHCFIVSTQRKSTGKEALWARRLLMQLQHNGLRIPAESDIRALFDRQEITQDQAEQLLSYHQEGTRGTSKRAIHALGPLLVSLFTKADQVGTKVASAVGRTT